MKNVLLLCLSTIKNARVFEYSFEVTPEKYETVTGCMTNEAPAKAVIRQLQARQTEGRLDRIVMICSDSVHQNVELEEFQGVSHIEAYRNMIDAFAAEQDECYRVTPIEYVEVSIPDFTEDKEVSEAVIKAASQVTEADEEVHLHVDFNGGQRYVAFMIVAIANLMKIRHVDVQQIMTMNFENSINKRIPIQNMAPVFGSFDLVSGINEYINYGRTKGLKNYFGPSQNKEIEKVLNAMEVFANNLQLCRTGYILREKGNLLKLLQEYVTAEREEQSLDTYEQMFLYVVKDILDGYGGLLDGELPDIIKWCVEKDFIQQALTFCAEELPDYLWKQKIYSASTGELKEYVEFLTELGKDENDHYKRLKNDYKSGMTETSSKFAYNWFIKYLSFSCEQREYRELLGISDDEKKRLMFRGPAYEELFEIKRMCRKPYASVKSEQLHKAANIASKYVWQWRSGRVSSRNINKENLCRIITLYFLLKEQRNMTNHASGEETGGAEWSYGELCDGLMQMVNDLLRIRG